MKGNDMLTLLGLLLGIYICMMVIEFVFKTFMKIKKHFERWNKWRKFHGGNVFYKLFVLLGIIHSPTLMFVLTKDELRKIDVLQEDNENASV